MLLRLAMMLVLVSGPSFASSAARTALYSASFVRGLATPGRSLSKLHRACEGCCSAFLSRPIRVTIDVTLSASLLSTQGRSIRAIPAPAFQLVRPLAGTSSGKAPTSNDSHKTSTQEHSRQVPNLAHPTRLRRNLFRPKRCRITRV